MNIESVKIVKGKLLMKGEGREFYLMDGIYRRDDGETITVRGQRIVNVFTIPNLKSASKEQLKNYIADLKQQLLTIESDAQLANIDLQNNLQQQQKTIQLLSNISKVLHDTATVIVRKIG